MLNSFKAKLSQVSLVSRFTCSRGSTRLACLALRRRWQQFHLLLRHLCYLLEKDFFQGLSHQDNIICRLDQKGGGESTRR